MSKVDDLAERLGVKMAAAVKMAGWGLFFHLACALRIVRSLVGDLIDDNRQDVNSTQTLRLV